MIRRILDSCQRYFESKDVLTAPERQILNDLRLVEDQYPVAVVSRADLDGIGFAACKISDSRMEELADKLGDDYSDQLFWESLQVIADSMELPRLPACPFCAERATFDMKAGVYRCPHCNQTWHDDIFVLAEYPEDVSDIEDYYPSFTSRDKHACYISEYDYLKKFREKPDRNCCFKVLRWPESKPYLNVVPDSIGALNEPVIDDFGIGKFGSQAIWVPLCNLR